MTLADIEKIDKSILTAADIADYLGTDPNTIRIQAHENAKMLGFPVIVLGSRVKIPKEGFIRFCKGE